MCPMRPMVFGLFCVLLGGNASADGNGVSLKGFQEVPAVSTQGSGKFRLQGDRDGTLSYELSYEGMEGNVLQAHIHFGQRSVNGGIVVFLCTNLGNSTVPVQACPPSPGSISGVIRAEDVIAQAGQGIAAGELAELVEAIEGHVAYVNVHSDTFPAGEVRAQLGHDDKGHHQHGHR